MTQATSKREEKRGIFQTPGNTGQRGNAQSNTESDASPVANDPTPEGHIYHERSDMDPPHLSLHQDWAPAENEFCQFNDPHNSGSWLPDVSETTSFNSTRVDESTENGTRAEESTENLHWTEPSFASELLDNSEWSTKSSPRSDITNDRFSPLHDCNEKLSRASDKQKIHGLAVENGNSEGRKRTTSLDHQAADIEEQRRLRQIIRNLEFFENEQRTYGQQQLKAIERGST